jgi:hypothetical protein
MYMRALAPLDSHWRDTFFLVTVHGGIDWVTLPITYLLSAICPGNEFFSPDPPPVRSPGTRSPSLPHPFLAVSFPTGLSSSPFSSQIGTSSFSFFFFFFFFTDSYGFSSHTPFPLFG